MKPASRLGTDHLRRKLADFRDDETGAIAIFVIFLFFLMLVFGGIAVDVMRMESRRVAMVQTLDRALLAAASLTQTRSPKAVAEEWFEKAGLGSAKTYEFFDPVITVQDSPVQRVVSGTARVRSNNFFMGMGFMPVDYLEAPSMSEAKQGIAEIEVMMVLDITGSMNSPASSGSTTKIADLRMYAQEFVDIVKENDKKNGVSIGMVPYAAQVNIPANLRQQFSVTNLSYWGGVANQGVPNINCIEIPTSSYSSTSLSQTTPMPMAAVADIASAASTSTAYVDPQAPTSLSSRICTTTPDSGSTPYNDETVNHVFLPTKNGADVKTRISRLVANGNTSIALGMRWGTALIDEDARPIYTAIGDATVQGRPAKNPGTDPTVLAETKKIIILMTDGEHVSNNYVYNAYKTGPSPIWRGADGRYAIRYTTGGVALTGGARPTCASTRTYFVPHLQTGQTCLAAAWVTTPTWTGSGTVRQLDWSEIWSSVRLSWVVRQLYMRSNVTGTNNFDTVMNTFRGTYLTVSNMNSLLQQNCSAAKNEGIIIYGIAFAAPTNGATQIRSCSTDPTGGNFFFDAQNGDSLRSAFQKIATDITDLRLTQ